MTIRGGKRRKEFDFLRLKGFLQSSLKHRTLWCNQNHKYSVQCLWLIAQSCPTLCNPIDCSLPGSSCPWEFSRQEYWSGLSCPPPGDLPNPGIKPRSPALKADSLPSKLPGIFPNEYSNKQNPKCLFFQEVSQNGSATLGIPRVFPAVCVTSNCV